MIKLGLRIGEWFITNNWHLKYPVLHLFLMWGIFHIGGMRMRDWWKWKQGK